MTILNTGSTKKFAAGWENIFTGKKKAASAAKPAAKKKAATSKKKK